jgi:hypothetical protein
MNSFFSQVRSFKKVRIKKSSFELPILYFRDDNFVLIFSADERKVLEILPTSSLYPVRVGGGRVAMGVGVFNYIDTTIGPYGEIGVVIPVVHGKKPPALWPLLRESAYPEYGYLVMHLPVTTLQARDGGRGLWGYTKFTSEMNFTVAPEHYECELSEKGAHIMTVHVERKGFSRRDEKPIVTYSVKDGNLIKTVIPQKAIYVERLRPAGSFVKFGKHPVAKSILALDISPKPLLSRFTLQRSGILPEGKIVEKGVRPLDGYKGSEKEGKLKISYR